MGRRATKLEFIGEESDRMHRFEKRKTSLAKKVSEISILCEVDACLLIYAPKLNSDEPVKLDTVWPSDSDELAKLIHKYKTTQNARKSYTVSDYFIEKKRNLDSGISKLHEQINGVQYSYLDNFPLHELRAFASRLDYKIEVASQKLMDFMSSEYFSGNYMNRSNFQPVPVSAPVCFQPGPSWFMNSQQLPQQQVFSDSDSMMNRSTCLNQLQNNLPVPVPELAPVCFQPGPSWFMDSQQQQQLFSDSNSMMNRSTCLNQLQNNLPAPASVYFQPGPSWFMDSQPQQQQLQQFFSDSDSRMIVNRGEASEAQLNLPIWAGTSGWNMNNNNSDSSFQMVAPPPPTQPELYSLPDLIYSNASSSTSNGFNR